MKRSKLSRTILRLVGYTQTTMMETSNLSYNAATGYLTYTDEHGDRVKANYVDHTPIVVDSNTTAITFQSTVYLGGLSAWTFAYTTVTNESGLNVINEVTFYGTNALIATTGGTGGRTITATGSGTTTLSLKHSDWSVTNPTASGTSSIVVSTFNSNLFASGGTMSTGNTAVALVTGTTYYITTAFTFKNQDNALVTIANSKLYYSTTGVKVTTEQELTAAKTLSFLATETGATTLTVYDYNAKTFNPAYTGVSYALTVTA